MVGSVAFCNFALSNIVYVQFFQDLAMTKADIVNQIAETTGLTKVETKAVVEGVFTSIMDALATGKRIELRGFGVFSVKGRKARLARNPRTGNPVPLDDRHVPIFKASPEFQERVNEEIKKTNG
ncbi:MAG: integration host factor subunit beta [Bacteroidetes bacterium]|nr:integration host factor subunit beta [Bacteroidota bacterium]